VINSSFTWKQTIQSNFPSVLSNVGNITIPVSSSFVILDSTILLTRVIDYYCRLVCSGSIKISSSVLIRSYILVSGTTCYIEVNGNTSYITSVGIQFSPASSLSTLLLNLAKSILPDASNINNFTCNDCSAVIGSTTTISNTMTVKSSSNSSSLSGGGTLIIDKGATITVSGSKCLQIGIQVLVKGTMNINGCVVFTSTGKVTIDTGALVYINSTVSITGGNWDNSGSLISSFGNSQTVSLGFAMIRYGGTVNASNGKLSFSDLEVFPLQNDSFSYYPSCCFVSGIFPTQTSSPSELLVDGFSITVGNTSSFSTIRILNGGSLTVDASGLALDTLEIVSGNLLGGPVRVKKAFLWDPLTTTGQFSEISGYGQLILDSNSSSVINLFSSYKTTNKLLRRTMTVLGNLSILTPSNFPLYGDGIITLTPSNVATCINKLQANCFE